MDMAKRTHILHFQHRRFFVVGFKHCYRRVFKILNYMMCVAAWCTNRKARHRVLVSSLGCVLCVSCFIVITKRRTSKKRLSMMCEHKNMRTLSGRVHRQGLNGSQWKKKSFRRFSVLPLFCLNLKSSLDELWRFRRVASCLFLSKQGLHTLLAAIIKPPNGFNTIFCKRRTTR